MDFQLLTGVDPISFWGEKIRSVFCQGSRQNLFNRTNHRMFCETFQQKAKNHLF